MSEVNKNMYLDLAGLKKYDELIKQFIAEEDSVLSNAIAALDAKLGEFEFDSSDDKTVAAILEDIKGAIAELVAKDAELEANDAELEKKIAEEIGKIVGDLGESESHMTLVEIAAQLKSLGGSVSKNSQDITDVTGRVATLEGTIEDLKNLGGENGLVAVVDKVNANTTAIDKLNGEGEGSVKKALADAKASAAELYQVKGDYEAAGAAAKALEDAQTYVNSKVDGKFDEKGAAATAQAAAEATAKAYVDGIVDDVTGEDGVVTKGLNSRIADLEAIDHDQLVADAVAAVVADADSDFDTLREVADWIAADTTGSAALQTTVAGHTESISKINGELDTLKADVEEDIENLEAHVKDAATALEGVDERLVSLEAFEETHASIPISEIEDWWYGRNTEE